MGRLLHDHQQLQGVASPFAPVETEPDLMLEDEVDDEKFGGDFYGQQYQPMPSDEPTFDTDAPQQAEQKRVQSPRPPTDARYQADPYSVQQRELFGGYYSQNQMPNEPYFQRKANSQFPIKRNHQPRRDTELFEALNEHIEALDQQMQTTASLRNVIDEKFPQPEIEWDHDVEVNEEYSSPQSDGYFPASLQNSFQANGQFQRYEDNPENTALRQELERLTADKRAAEEAAKRAEMELQEKERLEKERLEQERITASRAESARAELKKALEREMARFEEQRSKSETPYKQQPMLSIIKSNRVPQLPNTNDPFELLGLDYNNPPQDVHEIKRAFLKMAKKYHPDAVAADAMPEEREKASINFARINNAYQLLKKKLESWGDNFFATMGGGAMYEPRSSHIRQSFSRGYGFDDYGSMFSNNSYSARYGGRQPQPQNGNDRSYHYGQARSPFHRNRQEVGDNCHVSGKDFPPFFNS